MEIRARLERIRLISLFSSIQPLPSSLYILFAIMPGALFQFQSLFVLILIFQFTFTMSLTSLTLAVRARYQTKRIEDLGATKNRVSLIKAETRLFSSIFCILWKVYIYIEQCEKQLNRVLNLVYHWFRIDSTMTGVMPELYGLHRSVLNCSISSCALLVKPSHKTIPYT